MVAASNVQYSWTSSSPPSNRITAGPAPRSRPHSTIFVVVQTWGHPDRQTFRRQVWSTTHGPLFGGFILGLAWIVNSCAESLSGFYFGAIPELHRRQRSVRRPASTTPLSGSRTVAAWQLASRQVGYGSGTILPPSSRSRTPSRPMATDRPSGILASIQGAAILLITGFLRAPRTQGKARPPSPIASSSRVATIRSGSPAHASLLGPASDVHRRGDRRP